MGQTEPATFGVRIIETRRSKVGQPRSWYERLTPSCFPVRRRTVVSMWAYQTCMQESASSKAALSSALRSWPLTFCGSAVQSRKTANFFGGEIERLY